MAEQHTQPHIDTVAEAICNADWQRPNAWNWAINDYGHGCYRRMAEAAIAALQLTQETRTLQNYPEGLDIEIRTQRGVGTAECNQCNVSEHGSYAALVRWADNHAEDEHEWQGALVESRLVGPWEDER